MSQPLEQDAPTGAKVLEDTGYYTHMAPDGAGRDIWRIESFSMAPVTFEYLEPQGDHFNRIIQILPVISAFS